MLWMNFLAKTVLKRAVKCEKKLCVIWHWTLTSCLPFILQMRMSFCIGFPRPFCETRGSKIISYIQGKISKVAHTFNYVCVCVCVWERERERGDSGTRAHLAVEHFISRLQVVAVLLDKGHPCSKHTHNTHHTHTHTHTHTTRRPALAFIQ